MLLMSTSMTTSIDPFVIRLISYPYCSSSYAVGCCFVRANPEEEVSKVGSAADQLGGGAELSEPKEGSAANEGVANETTDAGEQVTRPTSSGETRLP